MRLRNILQSAPKFIGSVVRMTIDNLSLRFIGSMVIPSFLQNWYFDLYHQHVSKDTDFVAALQFLQGMNLFLEAVDLRYGKDMIDLMNSVRTTSVYLNATPEKQAQIDAATNRLASQIKPRKEIINGMKTSAVCIAALTTSAVASDYLLTPEQKESMLHTAVFTGVIQATFLNAYRAYRNQERQATHVAAPVDRAAARALVV